MPRCFASWYTVSTAARKKLYLGCNLNHYFTPPAEKAREYMDEGKIGEIVSMRSTTLLGPNHWGLGIKFLSPAGAARKKPNNGGAGSNLTDSIGGESC